jgi:hypothetical protein
MAKFLTAFAASKGIILLLSIGHWATVKYFSSNIKLRAKLDGGHKQSVTISKGFRRVKILERSVNR